MRRKQEAALRLLRGEPVELLSQELGVELYLLEAWREKAISGMETAMKRIRELTMQVELMETKAKKFQPLARRRSRR